MLVEQPHRLGRVEHRAAAERDQGVGADPVEEGDAAGDDVLVGLGLHLGEDVDVARGELAADVVDDTAGVGHRIGHDDHHVTLDVAQVVEGTGVEERRGRHSEPLRGRTPLRDGLDVEQLLVVDVLGRGRAAPRAAAQREGGRQVVVDAAQGTDGGGGVHQDPPGAHGHRVGVHHGGVAGVDGGGVAQAAVLGDQHRDGDPVVDAVGAHQPEHRHQLLLHQRVGGELVEVGRERGQEDLGLRGDGEAGAGRELGCLLAERGHVHLVAAAERELGERLGLLGGEEVRAHPLELGEHLVVHLRVDDAGLLRRADHRRVEGLGDQDVDHGAGEVGAAVDVDGRVARADAQAGLAGGVGESHDPRPAGDPDEVDLRVLEEVVRHLVLGVGDDLERAGRHPGGLGGRAQDLDAALARPHGVRRGPEDDRVAGLGRDDRLVEHRGRRVGDRGDREHDADRLGDADDVVLGVLLDHTHRALVAQVVGEELGGGVVLDHLVLEDAEAGLLDRERGELARGPDAGTHHGRDDRVHLLLVQRPERLRGSRRPVDQRVDRSQTLLRQARRGCVGRGRCGPGVAHGARLLQEIGAPGRTGRLVRGGRTAGGVVGGASRPSASTSSKPAMRHSVKTGRSGIAPLSALMPSAQVSW